MSEPDRNALEAALAAAPEPWLGGTLGDASWPTNWQIAAGRAKVVIEVGYPLRRSRAAMARKLEEALASAAGGVSVEVALAPTIKAHPVQGTLKPLAGIKNVIAVA
ncbi:MAG: iron-sulfur cluster assembly protein, partial [Gammaproteobacteria bacterium]